MLQYAPIPLIQPTSTDTCFYASYYSSCLKIIFITVICLCFKAFEEIGLMEISIIIRMVLILLISIMPLFILDY